MVIRKAVYGDLPDGAKVDVTDKVRALVKNGILAVAATDEIFGDPYNGKLKLTITSAEIRIPGAILPGGGGGAGDFTDTVKDFQRGNRLMTKISGGAKVTVYYNYGDGKALSKHTADDGLLIIMPPTILRVDYTVNDVGASKTVDLDQTLKISASNRISVPVNVAGTVWAFNDGDEFHFQADGSIGFTPRPRYRYPPTTWKQDGASIYIDRAGCKWRGTVSGNRMEGSAPNDRGDTWTWSADKK